MTPVEIYELSRAHFGEAVHDIHADPKKDKDPWFVCEAAAIVRFATWLRDEPIMAFDSLECLTGTDYPDRARPEGPGPSLTPGQIHVTLHLWSYSRRHRAVVKVLLPREAPVMPSLSLVWPVAIWQERECFDLLGVRFDGHPDLRRILLPEDWVGHPLRKDFVEAAHYHGIPTTRPAPLDLLKIGLPKGHSSPPGPGREEKA
jgi:NADH-quinone oxidoreductase subunit C